MKNFLLDLLGRMRDVLVIVVVGLVAATPTTVAVYYAVEKESWLLGAVAFLVFVLTSSLATVIGDWFGGY